MTLKYKDSKDNPKRVDLLINYIDKLCSLIPSQNEIKISLEKKLYHVFIQELKSLYEVSKIETIDFNGKTIEKDEPKLDKDFKESVFVYILYSINILNKHSKVIFYVNYNI